jgi:putative ABC transport system substrate-binding protein
MVDGAEFQSNSAALVGNSPDVIVALGSRSLAALQKETTTIPVIFNFVADPVAQGFVQSLARPGGNLTGLTNFEFSFAGKWLEALKEVEPGVKRVLLLGNTQNSGTRGLSKFVESLGPSHGVEMVAGPVRTSAEIEDTLNGFGPGSTHAVIVLPDGITMANRDFIFDWATLTRVPIVYPFRVFAESGGLMSWGLDFAAVYRQVATYVHRILRGDKPADLPVQAPNKFELVINLKAAQAIGLALPPTLLALADEVIE